MIEDKHRLTVCNAIFLNKLQYNNSLNSISQNKFHTICTRFQYNKIKLKKKYEFN